MTTPCKACTAAQSTPHSGLYRMQCLACCARLVMSAHPLKAHAGALLDAIERCPGNPGRAQVLESVSLTLARRASATKKSHSD